MDKKYVTVTGTKYYYDTKPFKVGSIIMCKKDYDNEYDDEAIRAYLPFIGTVGYIANSTHTVAKGTSSAGKIYDSVDNVFAVRVLFVVYNTVICEIADMTEAEIAEHIAKQVTAGMYI